MKRIKFIGGILLLLFLALFLITCSGGGGDSDSSNGNSKKTISQSLEDEDVMWAVNKSIIDIYNQNLGTTGEKNILGASCPQGGTVDIKGTTSKNNDVMTVDLSFDMTNCKYKNTGSDTIVTHTMSGTIVWTGSFNSSVKYRNLNFQATNLILEGTDQRTNYEDVSFDETVDYSSHILQNYSDSSDNSGAINGRPVSYTTGSSGGTAKCRYPQNKIKISISPTRCQQLSNDCATFRLYASSPQITSLISSGKNPCSMGGSNCEVFEAYTWSQLFCGDVSECTKGFITDARESFGGAMGDPSISITDTVLYCPKTSDGSPMGACVGSIVDQCNPDATITILIN